MNNENTKKKFNLFDFLICGLIVVALVLVAYFLIPSAKNSAKEQTLDFVIEVPTSTLDVLSLINEGDTVTLSGKSEVTIKNITSQPAQKLSLDQLTGEYKLCVVPERYDINITVSANVSETDKDISVENTPIKIGTKMSLEGRGFSVNGAVIDMKLSDKNGEEINND